MKPKRIADTKKDPTKTLIMPLETLIAPLPFGGGGEVVVDPEGEDGEGFDGVSLGVVGGVLPLGVVVGGVPLGVVLAATTLISSFMPPLLQ